MARFEPVAAIQQVLDEAAHDGYVDTAESIVDSAKRNVNEDTGHYRRSLQVSEDRRGVVAETTDVAGHIIEWGSVNNAPQAPLRRAAADHGKFEPS